MRKKYIPQRLSRIERGMHMKKKIASAAAILIVLAVLLFPIKTQFREGGTTFYTAILYRVISWHAIISADEMKTGTEVHFIPNNFHDYAYYFDRLPLEPAPTSAFSATSESNPTTTEPGTTALKLTTSTAARTETIPPDPVVLTPKQAVYPVGTEEITVTWYNGSEEDLIFGDPFVLQAGIGGKWIAIEPVNILLFLTIGYYLQPGESRESTYDIGHYYGPLEAGRYRIAANYHYDAERPINKNTPQHEVYAEFEIK